MRGVKNDLRKFYSLEEWKIICCAVSLDNDDSDFHQSNWIKIKTIPNYKLSGYQL